LDDFFSDVPVALLLGGFDPSGGAGLLRDAVVVSGLGVHPMAIPLAETAQNGFQCFEIAPPNANPIARLDSLEPHLRGNWGLKLSMFYDCALLKRLLPRINQYEPPVAVWDPVIAPTNGVGLHSHASIHEAFGLVSGISGNAKNIWLFSPNMPEARLLTGLPDGQLETVAKKLMDMGMGRVWIRGGHGSDETVQDLWCDSDGPVWLGPYKRLDGDPRGTGCTVTSAWLAFCLNGMEAKSAAKAAIQYIRSAWGHLHTPGKAGRPTFSPIARFCGFAGLDNSYRAAALQAPSAKELNRSEVPR